jgi:hypothetical protein
MIFSFIYLPNILKEELNVLYESRVAFIRKGGFN